MKTIGLIGGMSWESTVTYYEIINREVVRKLGGFHCAKILMYNVDFAELEENMSKGNWDKNAQILSQAAQVLQQAGADFIVIATNTMHKLVPSIQWHIQIPILHIADATAARIKKDNLDTPTTKVVGFLFQRPLHCYQSFSFTRSPQA